ncbi:MAG: methionine adenosyltransferase [Thaumarchaeota archaeon]|nr:methionine adenosyltransferase [Nitrososphaerota archaeon]
MSPIFLWEYFQETNIIGKKRLKRVEALKLKNNWFSQMNLEISFSSNPIVSKMPVEFVERKGKGHPDTISDRASEELSIALCEYYLSNFGRIYHHNVDKCVLVGGQSDVSFGGGRVTEPIYLLLVGRAAAKIAGNEVPIEKIAQDTTLDWMSRELHALDTKTDIKIATKIRPGSVDLVQNYDLNDNIPLSNDTSFGVWYGPNTDLENVVYNVETELNSKDTKKKYPAIGEDIKVMGVRRHDEINLTIACAMVSRFVKDEAQYSETKDVVLDIAQKVASKFTDLEVKIRVNTADNFAKKLYYLTVTGTSAEHGDDGQVGRGNRANGLITPFRPMTLEATAGKNPINHTGKIYNICASTIISAVLKEHSDLEQTSCYIVSEIGKPINQPQAINVELYSQRTPKLEKDVQSIVEEKIKDLPNLWKTIVKREHSIY